MKTRYKTALFLLLEEGLKSGSEDYGPRILSEETWNVCLTLWSLVPAGHPRRARQSVCPSRYQLMNDSTYDLIITNTVHRTRRSDLVWGVWEGFLEAGWLS